MADRREMWLWEKFQEADRDKEGYFTRLTSIIYYSIVYSNYTMQYLYQPIDWQYTNIRNS